MKIGVISDTHGKHYYMNKVVEKMGKVDCVIHLGDHCLDALEFEKILNIPVVKVRGNCDFSNQVPDSLELILEDKKLFITHGHLYKVKYGIDNLMYKASEGSIDIVLYGHTHIPEIFFDDDVLYMNPGSASSPKGGRHATIGVIHLTKDKIIPSIINLNE